MTLTGKRALVTGGGKQGYWRCDRKSACRRRRGDMAITCEKSAESAAEVVSAYKGDGAQSRRDPGWTARTPPQFRRRSRKQSPSWAGLGHPRQQRRILRLGELKDISLADIDALLNVNVRAQIIGKQGRSGPPYQGRSHITIGSYFADRRPHADPQRVRGNQVRAWPRSRRRWARSSGQGEITANLGAAGPPSTPT